jgi:hypothetical protein
MSTLYEIPAWYWVIAIAFSSYYAYRGYMGNWVAMVRQNRTITHRKWKNWEMISVFCVHDALFHFICSMARFIILFVANDLYASLRSTENFDTGKSLLLAFAFLFGVIGVTGQLPQLLLQGKIPFMK